MTNDQKNAMEMMVLTDLAGICKKLADTPGFPANAFEHDSRQNVKLSLCQKASRENLN